ncbi:MAG: DUF1080 domain-containing protein [Pirellulales bacterium]|nr:DUF1080 domain-containing protein [Pirellulales bacterium]
MIRNLLIALTVLPCLAVHTYAEEHELKPIFDGKTLDGWKVPKDNIWWTAKGGVLDVKSDPKRKGSTLWTDKNYKNFVVELDFKMGEGRVDSGVFLRSSDQIQIGESGSLKRDMTASPYIPGKGYPVEAKGVKELLKPKDWNTLTIKADGNHYTTWLNGKQVMTYESGSAKAEGPIGIQLHGNRDMQISFRNIKAAELP